MSIAVEVALLSSKAAAVKVGLDEDMESLNHRVHRGPVGDFRGFVQEFLTQRARKALNLKPAQDSMCNVIYETIAIIPLYDVYA